MAKKAKVHVEAKSLAELKEKLNEAYGIDWVNTVDECISVGTVKLSTGILEFDLALRGGPPYGMLTSMFGADSSGKTFACVKTVASALNTCRQCYTPIVNFRNFETGQEQTACMCGKMEPMGVLVVDAEDRYDMIWNQINGWPKPGTKAYDQLLIVKPTSADVLSDTVRDAIAQGLIDLVVIDSVNALFPESRFGRTAMEQQPGDLAKAVQNLIATIINENSRQGNTGRKCTVMATQQVREKIGGYGNPRTTSGGWMFKHMRSVFVEMMSPAKDEGINDAKRTGDGVHFIDFHGKVKKANVGASEGVDVKWRVYAKDYAPYTAGQTDNNKRLIDMLAQVGGAGKTKKGYELLGLQIEKQSDLMQLADHPSIQLAGKYAMIYHTLTADTSAYLSVDRYNYNPFYELNVEVPDDPQKFARITLVPRDGTKREIAKPTKGKRHKKVDDALKELNPPVNADN